MNADWKNEEMTQLIHAPLTEKIIGIYYDVYNEIGPGFLESVYSNCMRIALIEAGMQVQREIQVPVWFRNQDVGQFRADLMVDGLILLELKAVRTQERSHEAQLMNYLRATE